MLIDISVESKYAKQQASENLWKNIKARLLKEKCRWIQNEWQQIMLHGSLYNLTQRLMSPHQNKVAHLLILLTKYPLFTADLSILGIIMTLQSVTNNTTSLFKIFFQHNKTVTDIKIQRYPAQKATEAVLLIRGLQCHIFLIKISNRITDNNCLRMREMLWSARGKSWAGVYTYTATHIKNKILDF